MWTLLFVLGCSAREPVPCASMATCREAADQAKAAGRATEALHAAIQGCDLGDEDLCVRVAAMYLDVGAPLYDPEVSDLLYQLSCARKYAPACKALAEHLAAIDKKLDAATYFHKGCELGDQPLCVRSAAYAIEVQRKEVGLIALPDAVRGCELGDAPTCHAAITIAGGVGPPAGQELDAFTRTMLERACAAGETASCARP